MRKILYPLAAGLAAVALTPAAHAQLVNPSPIAVIVTDGSATFGDASVSADNTVLNTAGNFTRSFIFNTPAGFNLVSADISSIATSNSLTNIDFSSVTLNGTAFNILSIGVQEFRNLFNQNIALLQPNTIAVTGFTGGNAAFSGNLSFAAVSPVPEPAAWALMLIGFGAVGYSMRKRPTYKLAQAV